MPVISMFYGLIIRMFFLDSERRHIPHIHVEHGEMKAVFGIDDGEILVGGLSRQQGQAGAGGD